MNDTKNLLILAAKAGNIKLDYTIRTDGEAFYHSSRTALAIEDGGWFSPLTDSECALKLAMDLAKRGRIRFKVMECSVDAFTWQDGIWSPITWTYDNCDPEQAFRNAITRAAAEVGRIMP